jgi:hypothetical protein
MNGYKVITSDGEKVGNVVEEAGDNFIVETGHVRKAKHAIPKVFAATDEETETVCITVSKVIVEDSPRLNGDEVDEEAIARYYGLTSEPEPPETEPEADDPESWDLAMAGAEKERLNALEGESPTDRLTGRGHDPAAPSRKEPGP